MSRMNVMVAASLAAVAIVLSSCMSLLPTVAPGARNVEEGIGEDFPYEHQTIRVLDSEMAYVDVGEGSTFLLVHGNPTSSYLWRNVIPVLAQGNRVIAVDLIGMGRSGKPDIDYTLENHIRYFSAFVDALGLTDITLVLHDWGGALGVDYAVNNPDNVRGIAAMEAVIRPQTWDEAPMVGRFIFRRLRDPERGQELIGEQNYFVERLLPMMSGRDLTDAEMDAYRAPFPTVESRAPVVQWPREIPLSGSPERTHRIVQANYEALIASDIPMLLLYADPGMIVTDQTLPIFKADIPRLETALIGSGYHYVQEVQPTRIGELVRSWSAGLRP